MKIEALEAPRVLLEKTGIIDSKDITRAQWKATRMMNRARVWLV